MIRHQLSDRTWNRIYPKIRLIPRTYTNDEAKTRLFVTATHWIMTTGTPWRDLPAEFGNWNSIFKRFARWSDNGVWGKLHQALIEEPDMEWLLIDSTVVRAHPCAGGAPKKNGGQENQALGKSVGGFSTKIHATVDALGNPLRLILTAGQSSDAPQAIPLLQGFDLEQVLADRGYDSDSIVEFVEAQGGEAIIPSKKNRLVQREIDKHTYNARHLVECFMNKIKQFRRIFGRFDKYASKYMSFVSFASALIWVR